MCVSAKIRWNRLIRLWMSEFWIKCMYCPFSVSWLFFFIFQVPVTWITRESSRFLFKNFFGHFWGQKNCNFGFIELNSTGKIQISQKLPFLSFLDFFELNSTGKIKILAKKWLFCHYIIFSELNYTGKIQISPKLPFRIVFELNYTGKIQILAKNGFFDIFGFFSN